MKAHSIRPLGERLGNSIKMKARNRGERGDIAIRRYLQERILWRLAEGWQSLLLKGSFADYMRCPEAARPTPDLDVWLPSRPDDMQRILREHLSATFYTDEGVLQDAFEIDGIKVIDSHLHLDEPGLKLLVHCRVGDKRERVKVDFAFGRPRPESMEIGVQPSMVPGLPELRVCIQSRERSCAEKLHAMAEFGAETPA